MSEVSIWRLEIRGRIDAGMFEPPVICFDMEEDKAAVDRCVRVSESQKR